VELERASGSAQGPPSRHPLAGRSFFRLATGGVSESLESHSMPPALAEVVWASRQGSHAIKVGRSPGPKVPSMAGGGPPLRHTNDRGSCLPFIPGGTWRGEQDRPRSRGFRVPCPKVELFVGKYEVLRRG
jgi:hypothetical protein